MSLYFVTKGLCQRVSMSVFHETLHLKLNIQTYLTIDSIQQMIESTEETSITGMMPRHIASANNSLHPVKDGEGHLYQAVNKYTGFHHVLLLISSLVNSCLTSL